MKSTKNRASADAKALFFLFTEGHVPAVDVLLETNQVFVVDLTVSVDVGSVGINLHVPIGTIPLHKRQITIVDRAVAVGIAGENKFLANITAFVTDGVFIVVVNVIGGFALSTAGVALFVAGVGVIVGSGATGVTRITVGIAHIGVDVGRLAYIAAAIAIGIAVVVVGVSQSSLFIGDVGVTAGRADVGRPAVMGATRGSHR